MRQIALCAAALALANPAFAGGFTDEIIEPLEIIEVTEDDGSLPGWVIPAAIAVGLMALAAGSGSNDNGGGEGELVTASDMRLKTDITRVGSTADGLPLYQFRYIGHAQVYEGVMAQDVLQHRPEAVITGPAGVMFVDYGQLGVTMRAVN